MTKKPSVPQRGVRFRSGRRDDVNTVSSSANAQAALRGVLSRAGAIVVPDPQVLVPHASRLFDEQVNLRDEDTREEIRQLVGAVAHWCRRVQPEESGQVALATQSSRRVEAEPI